MWTARVSQEEPGRVVFEFLTVAQCSYAEDLWDVPTYQPVETVHITWAMARIWMHLGPHLPIHSLESIHWVVDIMAHIVGEVCGLMNLQFSWADRY